MNMSAGYQYLLVETEEFGVCQSFTGLGLSQLGVGEGEPNLFYFSRLEIGGESVDLCTEEGGVGNIFLQAFFGADVDPIAFEVYAQEIAMGVHFSQAHCVFAFTAGQLQGQGVVGFEESGPAAGHVFGVLKDIGESLYCGKTDQLFLAHGAKVRIRGHWAAGGGWEVAKASDRTKPPGGFRPTEEGSNTWGADEGPDFYQIIKSGAGIF